MNEIDRLFEKYAKLYVIDGEIVDGSLNIDRQDFRQAMHELINQIIEIVLPFILPNHTGDVREIIKDKLSFDILTKLEEQK